MRTLSAFVFVFLIASISFGQIKYEKGYFIKNDNQRVECFIKNMDWKYNPVEFSYKLKDSGATEKGNLASVREFGITESYKFINADVKIDRSTQPAVDAKNELDPVYSQEKLFLKVLIEGKAKLYGYESNKMKRFFYSLSDTAIYPLTYKEVKKGSTITKNTGYRQQLWDKLRYPKTSMELIKSIDYTTPDLKKYFKIYNESFGSIVTERKTERKRSYLNLKLTPGINSTSESVTIVERDKKPHLAFENNQSFRIGLEAELNIPFDNYKWGILFEPTFQSYKANAASEDVSASLTFSSVEFPIGLRYYIYINDNTRLYLNGFYIPGVAMNMDSKILLTTSTTTEKPYKVESSGNFAIGGGLEFKRFSIETRYYTNRDLFKSPVFESSDYNKFSVILGYKFMKKRFK